MMKRPAFFQRCCWSQHSPDGGNPLRVFLPDAYPLFQDRDEFLPLLPRGLTAANQNTVPPSIDAPSEDAQLIDVAGNNMVVADDHLPKPDADLAGAITLVALKLDLDGLELRNHSLLRRNSPDGEGLRLVTTPAVVGEAQER
jgi:hypothetical protein